MTDSSDGYDEVTDSDGYGAVTDGGGGYGVVRDN